MGQESEDPASEVTPVEQARSQKKKKENKICILIPRLSWFLLLLLRFRSVKSTSCYRLFVIVWYLQRKCDTKLQWNVALAGRAEDGALGQPDRHGPRLGYGKPPAWRGPRVH